MESEDQSNKQQIDSLNPTAAVTEPVEVALEPVPASQLLQEIASEDLSQATPRQKAAARKKVARALWRKYDLSWKLEPHQLVAYDRIKVAGKLPNNRFVLNASRRWGKTYLLCVLAAEFALKNPNSLILYAGATQKAVKDFILPTFNEIFRDAPDDLRGVLKTQLNQYVFMNGTRIKLTGLDGGRLQKLRGMTAHLIIVDEAGFIDSLETAVMSVLFPMTSTTGGQMLLGSNAPITPNHEFVKVFTREAQETGNYLKQTIFDVSKFTKEDIDRFAASCGGYESSTFQREYMGKFVIDESSAVIPEWNKYKSALVRDDGAVPRPDFYYPIVSIDLGLVDFTGVLFGYWHFRKGFLYIEDELLLKGTNSEKLVKACRAKESALWGEDLLKQPVRVADGQAFTINDIVTIHRYPVGSVIKDTLEAQVNAIRLDVQGCKLVVHPRCVYLLGQLEDAIWDRTRTSFARDSKNGHFDLLASLQYMVRHVNRHSNPYPANYQIDIRNAVIKENQPFNNPTMLGIKGLFAQGKKKEVPSRFTDHLAVIFNDPVKKKTSF